MNEIFNLKAFEQSLKDKGYVPHEGTCRRAYVHEEETEVIKIAKLDVEKAKRHMKSLLKMDESDEKHLQKNFLESHEESVIGLDYLVSRGLMENTREYLLTEALGNLVVPTRKTLNGIINWQDKADPLKKVKEADIRHLFLEHIGKKSLGIDPHSFFVRGNYGWHEGVIKSLDYGSTKAGKFMMENRSKVEAIFQDMMRIEG